MEAIDEPFRALALALPDAARAQALALPLRLGFAAGFGDYARQAPFRDLPAYAAEGLAIDAARLARFSLAHVCAGYHGVVVDRLADGKLGADALPDGFVDRLYDARVEALADALGDRAAAEVYTAGAVADWHAGVAIERALLAGEAPTIARYLDAARRRGRWLTVAATAMLPTVTGARFQAVAELVIVAAQCHDDAADADDDARLRGRSLPDVLGLPRGGLYAAAPLLYSAAAARARGAGFSRLAAWCAERAIDLATTARAEHAVELTAALLVAGAAATAWPVE